MTGRLLFLVVAATMSCASITRAQTLDFSFVGNADATWTQSSNPQPNFAVFDGYADVPVINGIAGVFLFGDVYFYTPTGSGGFAISEGNYTLIESGPVQIFTGSVGQPVFSAGQFILSNGTLTVTAVPEPSSWALMLVGVGVIGLGLRSRRPRHPLTTNAA